MLTQAKIQHQESNKKIARKFRDLTNVEKFYKKIKIFHKNTVLFPGRFGQKKIDCGTFKFSYSCDCGGLTKNIYQSCNNVNCPNCYTNVLRRSKKRITKKCLKILKLLKTSGRKKFPHFNHITFGPKAPEGKKFEYLEYKKFKQKYMRIIKKYNGSGVLFFHAYRKYSEKIEIKWKTNPSRTKVREITVMRFSPHFHLIGNIWIPKNHYKNEGFVIKKIKDKKTTRIIKIYKKEHLHSVVGYLLTHTTYYENTKMTSWIGKYSSYYVKRINERVEYEILVCIFCNEYAYRIEAEPFDIDDDYLYYSKYWRSQLNFEKPLCKKHEFYDLIFTNC